VVTPFITTSKIRIKIIIMVKKGSFTTQRTSGVIFINPKTRFIRSELVVAVTA